jgi:hypothetical protein
MVGAIEPVVRAKLVMALLALVVLGIGLLVMVVMGGRYARRIARTPLPPSRVHEDRWYAKPLNPSQTDPSESDSFGSDQANGNGDKPESGRQPDADGPGG